MGAETQSGAEALLKELEQKKANALKAIEEEFRSNLKELEENTRKEIEAIIKKAEADAKSKAQAETNRIIGAARLEAKRIIFDATDKMMTHNIKKLQDILKSYASTESYKKLVVDMAKYATSRLGKGAFIACRKEDKQLLNDKGFKIADNELQCIGGIKAFDSSKTLELDLTFEELLRMKNEQLTAEIMEKIE
jgi:Archaeal/vacuolar-type H+-ATPase subunit E